MHGNVEPSFAFPAVVGLVNKMMWERKIRDNSNGGGSRNIYGVV